jgi:hypothetical protein
MNNSRSENLKKPFLQSLQIFFFGILSFFLVLFVHSGVRGKGNISIGFMDIIQKDVLRRTYGDATYKDTIYSGSLDSNVFDVVNQYIFGWTTNLLQINIPGPLGLSIPGNYIFILISGVFGIVLYRFYKKDQVWKKDFVLLLGALAIPISWFVLAKGHSALHGHINFILWYFFTLGILLFVIFDWFAEHLKKKFKSSK